MNTGLTNLNLSQMRSVIRDLGVVAPSNKLAGDLGLKFYYTGKFCAHNHKSFRQRGKDGGSCMRCKSLYDKSEKSKSQKKKYNEKNKDKRRIQGTQWARNNRETVRESAKKSRRKHSQHHKERGRIYRQANPEKCRIYSRRSNPKKLAKRKKSVPKWLTTQQNDRMNAIYLEAKNMGEFFGIDFHVDHIVPIAGKNVCGLHVPWNLQILPAEENRLKSNKIMLQ